MKAEEIDKIHRKADSLAELITVVLDSNEILIVQIVLARLFAEVSVESGMPKEQHLHACEVMWDAIVDEMAKEPKH